MNDNKTINNLFLLFLVVEPSRPIRTFSLRRHGPTSYLTTSGGPCSLTVAATSPSARYAPSPSASTTPCMACVPGATTSSTWCFTHWSQPSLQPSAAHFWAEDHGACWQAFSLPLIPFTLKQWPVWLGGRTSVPHSFFCCLFSAI